MFVINNESGWYEGWMIHDITVPNVAPPRKDGHAQFGTITQRDSELLARMGTGNNVPGHIFTVDGRPPHFPSASDHFPDVQTNLVPINESMGAYSAYQQSDVHSYWEFNHLGTNWIHPLYELPVTGGFPDNFGQPPDALQDGEIGKLQSIVPGPGPSGEQQKPQVVGDNPNLPRDPDKFDGDVDALREFRERGVPSGLANEIYLDVYERPASFEPNVRNLQQRLFDAYAAEVKRVSGNDDGIITAAQGDIDTSIDGFADNFRPYLPQRPSIALPSRGRSMTGCWHRALPQASAPGCCRVYGCRSAPWWTPRPDVTPTIADVWHRKEAAGRPPSRFATPIRTGCQIGPNNPSQRNSSAICWSARTLRENRSAEWG